MAGWRRTSPRSHFLALAPTPSRSVAPGAGQRPTCWVGEEERQRWKRRLCSSHSSLQVEPEMIPFLYWSHWGGKAERGAQRGLCSAAPPSTSEPRGRPVTPGASQIQKLGFFQFSFPAQHHPGLGFSTRMRCQGPHRPPQAVLVHHRAGAGMAPCLSFPPNTLTAQGVARLRR